MLFMTLLHYRVCNICNMSLLAYVPHSSTGFYVAIFLFYLLYLWLVISGFTETEDTPKAKCALELHQLII